MLSDLSRSSHFLVEGSSRDTNFGTVTAIEVAAPLRRHKTSAEWPLGSRIPSEAELLDQLQVARGTLREAIRALEHSGLLDVRRGDGTYVAATSELSGVVQRLYEHRSPNDLLEVRSALDAQAARLAAQRATDAELDALDAILARRTACWTVRNRDGWVEADWEFHLGVANAIRQGCVVGPVRGCRAPVVGEAGQHERTPERDTRYFPTPRHSCSVSDADTRPAAAVEDPAPQTPDPFPAAPVQARRGKNEQRVGSAAEATGPGTPRTSRTAGTAGTAGTARAAGTTRAAQ
ncbi:GntR family transcriptional regulator [Rhodococcus erythropolis]|uniref:FadR/GntR family transcriptional regulator n=1 Tax=Rhodococcus erythropolis TaxID=1833 RepID=UPI002949AC53|nr:GntR family transcriptional regulator [Rhodococcus erythropolis]